MQDISTYELIGLLPAESTLVLNRDQDVLTLVRGCAVLEQRRLAPLQALLLQALFESYPSYCPYEVLLAVFLNTTIEQGRADYHRQLEAGQADQFLRPLRNLLSRCRERLHPFGIEAKSLIETGYVLVPHRVPTGSSRYFEEAMTAGAR